MTPPGASNPALLRVLEDVLQRHPEIVTVRYEPDAIQKRYLAAAVAPNCVEPPTGPEPPRIEVRWTTAPPHEEFRVDYSDPNVAFHCGWHRDDQHPDLGPTHFQYWMPGADDPTREPATFDATSPARILWTCLERLFEDVIPALTGTLHE